MSLHDKALDVKSRATKARSGKDKTHNKTMNIVKLIPSFILGPLMHILCYVSMALNWDLKPLQIKGRPHGPVVITNVGSLGMQGGFAPITRKILIEINFL